MPNGWKRLGFRGSGKFEKKERRMRMGFSLVKIARKLLKRCFGECFVKGIISLRIIWVFIL